MYGASLHQQEPDVAVAVGKDGYLKVNDNFIMYLSCSSLLVMNYD